MAEAKTKTAAGAKTEPEAADPKQPALTPGRVEEMIRDGKAELIDVRKQHEWEAGRIAGSRHVELNELPSAAKELADGKPLVVYCHGGNRSAMAAEALRTSGIEAYSLEGGIDAWVKAGKPLEPEDGHVAESGEAAEILRVRGRYVPYPESESESESGREPEPDGAAEPEDS